MVFDTGTWWLIGVICTAVVGAVAYLIKRSLFGRVDKCEEAVEERIKKPDYDKAMDECRADIKKIREDYTPRAVHDKDMKECRDDIKQIKEDYITKDDFFREQAKTDRKLDRIMDILLEMKGDKKGDGK